MKTSTFLLILLLSPTLFAQGWKEYIAQNALPVGSDLSIDSTIYPHFQDYKLIMIGEMHGTQESAKITEQLARLILSYEDRVSIGLEIPENELRTFLQNPSEKTLRESRFFSKPNEDGRNGQAWFDLIRYSMSNPQIHLFFYDNGAVGDQVPRDSTLYLEIKKQALAHPKNKILTISGNIHNQLIQQAYQKPMGAYLSEDSLTFAKGSICSIYHYYAEGTMLNDVGNGLELTTIEFEESDFTSGPSENYFLFYESAKPTPNNCIFFTRKVNHSPSIDLKK